VIDRINTTKAPAVLVTCSALRSSYRHELRVLQEIAGLRTVFIMLETDSRGELKSRLARRQDHYIAPAMVDAQVDLLEAALDEEIDVVPVNAAQSVEEVADECGSILQRVIHG
jgi:carbohydrate kinase (thermoresistant glucokinase family)